tara:strand:+ start:1947 stop:2939 length:993 start_codon:yes stop_codon:yes gene_type:complete
MIIKNYEITKFIDQNQIFLIYGENEGLKEDIILNFTSKYSKESIIKYSEKEVQENLTDFYNNILSQSFFDTKKLILISEVTDKLKNEIEIILSKNITDVSIILISKILEKKSNLRNMFEKDKKLICIPVYKDDHKTLLNIASNFFRQKKIIISVESLNLIIERSSEDRKNLKNELYKIENFIGNKKKIDISELVKLTNLAENHSINKMVDLTLAKNTKQTLRTLNENILSSDDVFIIIRTFLIKSKRILKLAEELEKNKNVDQVISTYKPPVFWKEKDIVKKQMSVWTKEKVKILIKNINNIELLMKKNASSSINILRDFIIEQSSISNN